MIHKQICAVMADIDAIGKTQRNEAQRFNFRGIDDVYNSLHSIFATHGIFTVPTVLAEEFKEEIAKNGTKCTRAIIRIKYTIYAEDGSFIDGVVTGEALDYGDKAANKAMAVAHKYFLTQTFTIPTQDLDKDPDSQTIEIASKPLQTTSGQTNFERFSYSPAQTISVPTSGPLETATAELTATIRKGHIAAIEEADNIEVLQEVFSNALAYAKKTKDSDFIAKVANTKDFRKDYLLKKSK